MSKSLDESDTTSEAALERKGSLGKLCAAREVDGCGGRDARDVGLVIWRGYDVFESDARWVDIASEVLARFDAF